MPLKAGKGDNEKIVRNRIAVLNVKIDVVTMNEAVQILEEFIAQKNPHLVATANAEMVMMAQEDLMLERILDNADLVVPDGAGVVWAVRHQGYQIPERVAGYDLTQQLLAKAALNGYRVYLFGGAHAIAEKAKTTAETLYPGINIVKTRHGFFTPADEPEIIADIQSCKPDILLVALGIPKQEKWLFTNLQQLGVPVCMGVGGSFDVMAGTMRRAPLWMQHANLEWLSRLLAQPKRFIRMLALPRFVLRVILGKKH